ncbi:type IV pilus assembly protein PilM [Candidatus Microgenomates bacterium]|nr:type IV pilus assembly protein PilM [Candidatus Microgenomates bacterium]
MPKFINHIGLDIGSESIKLVQLEQVGDKFSLQNIGQIETPVFPNQVDADKAKVEAIKKLIKDTGATSKQVTIALAESQVYTRVIEMPVLEEPELSQAIRWQVEQYIPVPLSDVVLKHQVLGKHDENKGIISNMNVLLVAAPSLLLNNLVNTLSSAGLEAVGIETEILAVARTIVGAEENSPTTLLVHMGAESTTLSILSRSDLVLTQAVSTGGQAVTRAIVTTLRLEVKQAEEYKRTYGLDPTKLDGKVAGAIKPVIELLLSEIKRVLAFYNTHGVEDQVKRVVLTGGTSLLPGLIPHLALSLDMEAQVGNPFHQINLNNQQKTLIGDNGSIYATAVGLALKLT